MPECEFCGEEVAHIYICSNCEARFCEECGSPTKKICVECLEEEQEAWEEEEYPEERHPR